MNFEQAIVDWEPIGLVAPEALRAARLEGQWAARIAGAVGEKEARAPAADYGHLALTLEASGWAVGAVTQDGLRIGVQLTELALGVFGEDGELRARIELAGLTLAEAGAALGVARGSAVPGPSMAEIEDYPLGAGGRFGARSAAAAAELGSWFRNGDRFVRALAAASVGASPARIWPHHFDVATAIALDPPGAAEPRSIGFGLSPGDSSYQEPYFYTSPWPVTAETTLAPLAGGGHWHREGFISAILLASSLGGDPGRQVDTYLRSALAACRSALGAT